MDTDLRLRRIEAICYGRCLGQPERSALVYHTQRHRLLALYGPNAVRSRQQLRTAPATSVVPSGKRLHLDMHQDAVRTLDVLMARHGDRSRAAAIERLVAEAAAAEEPGNGGGD